MFWYHNVRATQEINATYDQFMRPTIETADAFTRSLPVLKKGQFEGHHHEPGDLPHPIPRLEHHMSVRCTRNIKVDLDIARRGYVGNFLLRKSTYQIQPFAYTQGILYPPGAALKRLRALCGCFRRV